MTTTEPRPAPRIDVHGHWYPEGLLVDLAAIARRIDLVAGPEQSRILTLDGSVALQLLPYARDLAARFATLDQLSIAFQVVSLGAVDIAWGGARAPRLAQTANDEFAALCREHPRRLGWFASVPLHPARRMVAVLHRALADGALGVSVTTTYGGRTLDDPRFAPFWRELHELRLPVLVHPCFPPRQAGHDRGEYLLAGFPGETTLAASRLILSGVLEAYGGVQPIWSHVGGALPVLVARLDAGHRRFAACPRPPSEYLRRTYFDTVCTHVPALACAVSSFGADRLLFGTDEPHRLEHPSAIVEAVRSLSLPVGDTVGILGGNAAALFASAPGIRRPQPAAS